MDQTLWHLTKEDIQMANEHIKISFTYVTRKMQIKTKCHRTLIRMAKIWNTDNTKHWWECRAMGILDHCWWNAKWHTHCARLLGSFLKHQTHFYHMTFWQFCPLLFTQNLCILENMLMNIWVALFIIAKTEKQPRCSSVGEQINCGILFSTKEKWTIKPWKHMRKD